MRGHYMGNNAVTNCKDGKICANFSLLTTCATSGLDPIPDIDPEAEPEPQKIIKVPQNCYLK